MLEAFDSPTTTQSCERRLTTTVATQALQLMNDAFTNQQAAIMSGRVVDSGCDDVGLIRKVYWRSLARAPTAKELSDCHTFLEEQREYHRGRGDSRSIAKVSAMTDLCHVMFNLNEFVYID